MKPNVVRWASRCLLLSIVLGLVGGLVGYAHIRETLLTGHGQAGAYFLLVVAEAFVVPLLIWFFTFRRASTIAKWFLVAFTILEAWGFVAGIEEQYAIFGAALFSIGVASLVLKGATSGLLFTPQARQWFARRGRRPGKDAEPFG